MIKVFATGNIGKDAEVKQINNDTSVTKFSIASNKVNKKGEKVTTWLFCQKWNSEKLAPYLTKGTSISVMGDLEIREHEGKTFTTLNVWELEFGGNKNKSEGNQEIKPDKESFDNEETGLPESESQEEDDKSSLPF